MIDALLKQQIVVAVTGSIAAYKSADLVRKLKAAGADVRVVMTTAATQFITPLTLQTLSGHPVAIELLDADQESAMGHIELARWADWVLIAPASADTLSRMAQGRADDLLTAMLLATDAPVAVAPAMNNKMWLNSSTQSNLSQLKQLGHAILGPASGEQACGEVGEGRMLEAEEIVDEMRQLTVPKRLEGKTLVITAGPTYEAIDPVRFIGNRSSGKMGFALAQAAAEAGAVVKLISGPVALSTPTGVARTDVESAKQMATAVHELIDGSDIFISCAAVADYRPKHVEEQKIKKDKQATLFLSLTPTEDIVSAVAQLHNKPFIVGFAAETQQVSTYAQDKLLRKKMDMIAANEVGKGKGFAVDHNALNVFWSDGQQSLPETSKKQLARQLMTLIIDVYYAKNTIKTA
jgi:phosphopantothenoylcysteine decarboxylase/phosphopantothenate--cysteine ligase